MRTCRFIKAITVVCTGFMLTMAGASAYAIADFPTPFVLNGRAQDNLAIIVGEKASSSDVIAALDISMFLQKSAKTNQTVRIKHDGPLLSGDAVSVGSLSDQLEINETLGSVREVLTEVDLDFLSGGQIVTQEGSTEYNQYLRFPSNEGSGQVKLGEAGNSRVAIGLDYKSKSSIFTWELEFEEGFESKIEDGHLVDLEDEDVFILGEPFVVVDAEYDRVSNRASITFLNGVISGVLGENERETFYVDGKEYDVEVLVISETSNNGEGSVKFRINEELTDELEDGDTDILADGTMIGIRDILPSAKNIQKSLVQFYVGAYSIKFFDKNATDDVSNPASVLVNREIITESASAIKVSELGSNNTFKISKINYTLFTETLTGGATVLPGQTVRSKQLMPEGFLTQNWDMVYLGLKDVGSTFVVLDPSTDTTYDLQFTNQEGIFYDVPFMINDGGSLRYGDEDYDLWFCESSNSSAYQVTTDDFFVLSNCDPSTVDNTCFSHVLRYDSIDSSHAKLSFTDLGVGKRDVSFDNSTRRAEIVVGGVSYLAFVDPIAPHNLSIDFNGNGILGDGCAHIGIQGEGLILLGRNNTNESGAQGPHAFVANNTNNLSIITYAKEFDEASQNENVTIKIEARANNVIGVSTDGIKTSSGGLFGPFSLQFNTQIDWAQTLYGLWIERLDPSGNDTPETITIEYPLQQRTAEVYVTESPWTAITADTEISENIQPISQPLSRLADEVADISKYNAIIVGGPCANSIAADLMGDPQPCTQPFIGTPGLLELFKHSNGNIALLVAGLTADNTRAASNVLLIYGKDYNSTEAKLSSPTLVDAFVRRT